MAEPNDEEVIAQAVDDLTPRLDPYQGLGLRVLSWLTGKDFSSMPISQFRKLVKAKIKESEDG